MEDDFSLILKYMAIGGAIAVFMFIVVFSITGTWPPTVTVASGSMEPHVPEDSLVVLTEPGRYESAPAIDTYQDGTRSPIHGHGDIISYTPTEGEFSSLGHPILHRAMFKVEEGQDWYELANADYIPPHVDSCAELTQCPSPESGYITKGDANEYYDQAMGGSGVVQEDEVNGQAIIVIKNVGYISLVFPVFLFIFALLLVSYSVRYFVRAVRGPNESTEEEESTDS